ncbi:MAG: M24 family metallopeptidase [Acidobacteriota bacterium]
MQHLAFGLAALLLAPQRPTPTPTAAPAAAAVPLKVRARKERVDRYLLPSLRRASVDAWLVVTREGSVDPVAFDVAAEHAVGRAACLFLDRGDHLESVAIVASFDTDAFQKSGLYARVVPYGKEGAGPGLKAEIEKFSPKAIAVDQSRDAPLADGLTAGNLQWIRDAVGADFAKRLVSAEGFLVSFRSRKTPAEIVQMRSVIQKTEQILAQALSPAVIVPGKTTEKDVADFIRKRRREMGLTSSWAEDQDPNVMAGLVRGHSAASDTVIQPGGIVRIDAGADEYGYKSDIQRMAYVLRAGEKEAPPEVQKAFDTVKAANRAASSALKPGATGTAVDSAGRKVITDAGYPEFVHATGHPIGIFTHDLGPMLAPDWPDRYGKLGAYVIEKDQTFAVEPSLEVELPWMMGGKVGFGLEEDYVVVEGASQPLGNPQESLILIPSGPAP